MDPVFADIAKIVGAAVAGAAVVVAGRWSGRKLGLSEAQDTLIETLRDTVAVQGHRIENLEKAKTECMTKLADEERRTSELEKRVERLLREADARRRR